MSSAQRRVQAVQIQAAGREVHCDPTGVDVCGARGCAGRAQGELRSLEDNGIARERCLRGQGAYGQPILIQRSCVRVDGGQGARYRVGAMDRTFEFGIDGGRLRGRQQGVDVESLDAHCDRRQRIGVEGRQRELGMNREPTGAAGDPSLESAQLPGQAGRGVDRPALDRSALQTQSRGQRQRRLRAELQLALERPPWGGQAPHHQVVRARVPFVRGVDLAQGDRVRCCRRRSHYPARACPRAPPAAAPGWPALRPVLRSCRGIPPPEWPPAGG